MTVATATTRSLIGHAMWHCVRKGPKSRQMHRSATALGGERAFSYMITMSGEEWLFRQRLRAVSTAVLRSSLLTQNTHAEARAVRSGYFVIVPFYSARPIQGAEGTRDA
jgi:hypothetical protein